MGARSGFAGRRGDVPKLSFVQLGALTLLAPLSGCGLLLDLDPPDDAGRVADAAAVDAAPMDAAPLDAPGSFCGDGVVDVERGEECDEESAQCVGCQRVCECPPIEHPCLDRIDCVAGRCEPVLVPDGTACSRDDDRVGACQGGLCVPERCGDGAVDPAEECDDANTVRGDGCEPDCVFSCHANADCDDRDPCNGGESCLSSGAGGTELRRCVGGEPPALEPCEVCTADRGPHVPDADGDGFPADLGQACEAARLDCDDLDPATHPGAEEMCDASDDDCDGAIDEGLTAVTCGLDLDGDGFPGVTTGAMLDTCTACPAGMAPLRFDGAGSPVLDCWDVADDFGPLVHPGQSGFFVDPYCAIGDPGCALPFDYDCDGVEEQADIRVGPRCDLLSLAGCRGDGWIAPVPTCGAWGTYADCQPVLLLTCGARREPRQQACR